MKLGEPSKLKNSFPPRSGTIKWFTSKFCQWGTRAINTKSRGVLGSPAPLWMNESEKQYKWCFVINLISSLVFIIFFIFVKVYNAAVQTSIQNSDSTSTTDSTSNSSTTTTDTTNTATTSTTSTTTGTDLIEQACLSTLQQVVSPQFIIIGSSILFINAVMARFMQKQLYASDEEWFRYLVIYFVCCSSLSGFNLAEYFQFKSTRDFFKTDLNVNFPEATKCIFLFQLNIWCNFINMIAVTFVCGFQTFLILKNYLRFFYFKKYQVARYEDKDIEVYSV